MIGVITLAMVVTAIAGRPVPVQCEPLPPNFYGITWFAASPSGVVSASSVGLAPAVCSMWDGFTPSIRTPDDAVADELAGVALFVAVHEGEHVRYDDANEAPTECRALRDFGLAVNLVVPASGRFDLQAHAVRELLWQGAELEDAEQPSYYHGGSC